MKTRVLLPIAIVVLLLGSCEFALGPRTEGTLVLNLAGPASRAFSDPPFEGLPVFSSVTVTVSGSGMPTASLTAPGDAGSVTIQVPAGPTRKVEVYAVPDWAATADIVFDPLPTLAKAYGGTVVVDVAGGQTVNVAMDMDVVETKIVLPDLYNDWSLVNSINAEIETYSEWLSSYTGYFQFDRFGRLITSESEFWINVYNSPTNYDNINILGFPYYAPFAYSKSEDSLYAIQSGSSLIYVDPDYIPSTINIDPNFETVDAIAVDEDGYVYLAGNNVVAKFLIDHSLGTASRIASATFESLDLGYWDTYEGQEGQPESIFLPLNVRDMTVKDGKLYVAAGENYGITHHGKVIEIRLSDLAKQREIGWSPSFPSSPNTQFYGPTRFLAIAPRKLIVADEGNDGSEINRVVEVDLDDWSFSYIRDPAGVDLFNEYFIAH